MLTYLMIAGLACAIVALVFIFSYRVRRSSAFITFIAMDATALSWQLFRHAIPDDVYAPAMILISSGLIAASTWMLVDFVRNRSRNY